MKIDPIHQFNIEPLFTLGHIGNHTIAFTNSSLYISASDGPTLVSAMMTLFGRAMNSPYLKS